MMVPIFNPEQVRLTLPILLKMMGHADLDQSVECCGLLGGSRLGSEVQAILAEPIINTLKSPVQFEADPADMFRVLRLFREKALDWVGTYHSHPVASPLPSRIDLERRQGGGMIDLILGRAGEFEDQTGGLIEPARAQSKWVLRAWDLSGDGPRGLNLICEGWAEPVEWTEL